MNDLPRVAGGVDAYEFHVEVALHFHCDDCDEHLECVVKDDDVEAPQPPWATREGLRGMALGWYVPPLTANGSLRSECFCPNCARKRGLVVRKPNTESDEHGKTRRGHSDAMNDEPPIQNAPPAPRPCFTLFDGFHFSLPLIVGAGVFLMTWRSLGLAWGTALAALLTLLSFWVFRYAIPAFVLFLHRHQIGNARVKDQVACYVVTHFRSDKAQGKNEKG